MTVKGAYYECVNDVVTMDEFSDRGISELDFEGFMTDAAYAAYCANALPERPKAVYDVLKSYGRQSVTLEKIMQRGKELPETEAFIRQWILFLGGESSWISTDLLIEALEMAHDPQLELETARKFYPQHPSLYMQYIENNTGTVPDESLLEIAKEAVEAIPVQFIARSETALCLSRIALGLGRQQEAEYGWLEAFRSDSSVANYLRLRAACEDYSKASPEVTKICKKLETRKTVGVSFSYQNPEMHENQVSNTTVHYLSFLQGRFTYVAEHVMNVKEALGWSYTFMKKGLALYLLLLYQGTDLKGKGCLRMCKMAAEGAEFRAEAYENGLLKKTERSNEELFWQCFCRWKETVSLTEEDWQKYLYWVEQLIKKRVRGIMEANRRNYYEECAAFVAALGEVTQSKGNPQAAQQVMLDYKQMYARRSAFHRELKAFGMKS